MSYSSDEEESQVVLFDNGTFIHKAGFTGDDAPRSVFPSVVGYSKVSNVITGIGQSSAYVGDEAINKQSILSMTNPIEDGRIVDFDAMEKLWNHTFHNELRVVPEEHSVIHTYPSRCSNHQKEGIAEVTTHSYTFRC